MVLHLPKEQCMAGITGLEAAARIDQLIGSLERLSASPISLSSIGKPLKSREKSASELGVYIKVKSTICVHHVATLKPKRMDLRRGL